MKIKLLKYTIMLMFGIVSAAHIRAKFIGYDKVSWQGIFFNLVWVRKDRGHVMFHGSPLTIERALEVFYQKDEHGLTPILFLSPKLEKGMIQLTILFNHLNPACPYTYKPDGMGSDVYYTDEETKEIKRTQNIDVWISGEATLLPSALLALMKRPLFLSLAAQPGPRICADIEADEWRRKLEGLITLLNNINTLLTPEAKEYIERVKPLCVNSPKEFLEQYPGMFNEEETKIMQSHIAQSAGSFDDWANICDLEIFKVYRWDHDESLKILVEAYIKDNADIIDKILQELEWELIYESEESAVYEESKRSESSEGTESTYESEESESTYESEGTESIYESEGNYETEWIIQEFCKTYNLKDIKAVEKKIFSVISDTVYCSSESENKPEISWLISAYCKKKNLEYRQIRDKLYKEFDCLKNYPEFGDKTMHGIVWHYVKTNPILSS